MNDVTTIAAVGVLVLLVHAAFAVYLYRSLSGSAPDGAGEPSGTGESEPFGEPSGLSADPEDRVGAGAGDRHPGGADGAREGAVQCPTCGTPNDPRFQFCRRCVSELSGSEPPRGGRGTAGT